jgi:hypothetical protein
VRARGSTGAASAEQIGIVLLVALLFATAIAAIASRGPDEAGPALGSAIARKLRCAPRVPGPCWRDPLTEAYGRPLAGLVRALAPVPGTVPGADGTALLPVDFRYCRRPSCAVPSGRLGLTASNRRVTAFTSVVDNRRAGEGVRVTYWLYRPGIGWDRVERRAGPAQVTASESTPLLETANPRLVPLETLPGRNHYDFPANEEPPWRWSVRGVYPG